MNSHLQKICFALVTVLILSSCGSKWQVPVSLTPEEITAAKTEIQDMKEAIKNYQGPEGQIPIPEIIRLAKAYETLGDLKSAIHFYKSWLAKGYKTKAIINNLGRLYEKVGETDLAIEQYQRIMDEYFDTNYLYDITWIYIRLAQSADDEDRVAYRKKAEKYFNAWQLDKRKTDEQTQEAIKQLRDAEAQSKDK